MTSITHLLAHPLMTVEHACKLVGLKRSTYYRQVAREHTCQKTSKICILPGQHRKHPRALSPQECETVLSLLDGEFVDVSPYQAFATLLDRGEYVCSISTMYRLLRERAPLRERRNQLRHPRYPVPRLMATGPNQVWSWDITKLPGPQKWKNYYLYVILDIYSRYIVGFVVAEQENSELAVQLIRKAYENQKVQPGEVTLHADRGTQMTSKTTSQLLMDLGIEQSHSRPRVSNDNAYSESGFKTLKYHPDYPGFFGSIEEAQEWARELVKWYNHSHHHKGIGLMYPADVHYGHARTKQRQRQEVMEAAKTRHPERFVRGEVKAPGAPEVVYLNPRLTRQNDIKEQEDEADTGEEKQPTQPVARVSSPGGALNARAVQR